MLCRNMNVLYIIACMIIFLIESIMKRWGREGEKMQCGRGLDILCVEGGRR